MSEKSSKRTKEEKFEDLAPGRVLADKETGEMYKVVANAGEGADVVLVPEGTETLVISGTFPLEDTSGRSFRPVGVRTPAGRL